LKGITGGARGGERNTYTSMPPCLLLPYHEDLFWLLARRVKMKFLRNHYRIGNSAGKVKAILLLSFQSLTGPPAGGRFQD